MVAELVSHAPNQHTVCGPSVLVEIQTGHGMALSTAGRRFPGVRGNAGVDPSTVFRWVTQGTKATDGSRVKLEAVRVGGRWLTSDQAIARFVAALTGGATAAETPAPRQPSARQRSSEAAAKQLEQMGA